MIIVLCDMLRVFNIFKAPPLYLIVNLYTLVDWNLTYFLLYSMLDAFLSYSCTYISNMSHIYNPPIYLLN